MAQGSQSGSAAARPRRFGRRLGGGWLETVIAIVVFVVVVGIGYYGLYVNARTQQLTDYYTRQLAASANITAETIDGLWQNICYARNRADLALIDTVQASAPTRARASSSGTRELASIGEIASDPNSSDPGIPEKGWCASQPGPAVFAFRENNESVLAIYYDGVERVRSSLDTLLTAALPELDVDGLLLAQDDGAVLFSKNRSGLRVERLPMELGTGEARETLSPQVTAVSELAIAKTNYKLFTQPVSLPIEMRWFPSSAAAQSCAERMHNAAQAGAAKELSSTTSQVRGCSQDSSKTHWFLVGLKDPGKFRAEAMAISPSVILATFGVAMVALLSLPYLKLRFLGRREALRSHDILVQLCALLVGSTLFTFAVLEIYARAQGQHAISKRVLALNNEISVSFREEVAKLDTQLRVLSDALALNASTADPIADDSTTEKLPESPDKEEPPVPLLKRADLPGSALDFYPLLSMAYWIGADGLQKEKWTTGERPTALVDVSSRNYFTDARDQRFFKDTAKEDKTGQIACSQIYGSADANSGICTDPGYALESIRSRTTGTINVVLAQRLHTLSTESSNKVDEDLTVAAALAPLVSVIKPTLVPGFSFAIIDATGRVIFHSDAPRNLRENFFDELRDPTPVQAAIWANRGLPPREVTAESELPDLTVEYHAKPHRAVLRPLEGTPWTLVTLYELNGFRVARAEVLTFALGQSLIYTVVLFLIFGLLHLLTAKRAGRAGTVFHWLWPCVEKRGTYIRLLLTALVAALAWILMIAWADPAQQILWAGLLGVTTFVICYLGFFRAVEARTATSTSTTDTPNTKGSIDELGDFLAEHTDDTSEQDVRLDDVELQRRPGIRLYVATVVAIIVVISVLPPISFYRAANDEVMSLFVMRDQLRFANSLRQRSERIAERYSSVSISAANAQSIEDIFYPDATRVHPAWDVHAADWRVRTPDLWSPGNSPCDDRSILPSIQLPVVAALRSSLVGFVQESQEIRSLSRDAGHCWTPGESELTLFDGRSISKPRLADEDRTLHAKRPPLERQSKALEISSRHQRLVPPWEAPKQSAVLAVLSLAVGGLALLWYLLSNLSRLVFLTDLRPPGFLPIRNWGDVAGVRRGLLLRGTLENADPPPSDNVIRLDGAGAPITASLSKFPLKPEEAQKALVLIDRFHIGLADPEIAVKKLEFLEALGSFAGRVFIRSDVNPLHFMTMKTHDFQRGEAPDAPDLDRWAAALSGYTRCRSILDKAAAVAQLEEDLKRIRESAVEKPLSKLEKTIVGALAKECWPDNHLREVARQLVRQADIRQLNDAHSLINKVLDQAEAHYRVLWSLSGKDERMVLFRIASHGFASWRSRELVRRLLHRGLIYTDPEPLLMNQSFRRFVVEAELPEVFAQWTQEGGASPWVRLRTPLVAILVGIFLFLFSTQPQLFSQSLAFITATAAILPTVIKLISIFAGSQKATAD
ncbi:MAG: hypothetical protein AAF756_13990 [Pseudomonadota bacterium]